jgi:hypothetical protein
MTKGLAYNINIVVSVSTQNGKIHNENVFFSTIQEKKAFQALFPLNKICGSRP